MRPTDARIWHPNFLIFNDSIIQESSGDARFRTLRRADNGGESRKSLRSVPLWNLELSNLQLSPEQYEEVKAFGWENRGMRNAFLVRNSRNCLLENADDEAQVLGIGDGVTREFPLIKTRPIQGRTGQYERIYFPNFRYPALEDFNCEEWDVLPELQLYVGDLARTAFDLNRTTGIPTFDTAPPVGAIVSARGGFYTLMISNVDGTLPVTPDGPLYRVSGGVSFSEPEGGAAAELLAQGLI